MNTHSEKFIKKRRFLLILPVIALPFITLAFWSLGGGKVKQDNTQIHQKGLNRELPEAQLPSEQLNKLSIYNQADKDSLALLEQSKGDPYAGRDSQNLIPDSSTGLEQLSPRYGTNRYPSEEYADPNEKRVMERLASLQRTINGHADGQTVNDRPIIPKSGTGSDVDRLEGMMKSMAGSNTEDPEIGQLNSLMEKLLDLQNPQREKERVKALSAKNRERVYSVSKSEEDTRSSLLGSDKLADTPAVKFLPALQGGKTNAFYDLEQPVPYADTLLQAAIPAVVNETQTLVEGAAVKMRISEDIYIDGVLIPSGTFVSGGCSIDGERLKINVSSIRFLNNLFPVSLVVYDLDALEGIRIPGAITRDAAKEGADRAVQSVQLMSLDPSIAAQAAGAGIEAAKGLFSKKAKLIRVTVKAGHPVLLLDSKAKQEAN